MQSFHKGSVAGVLKLVDKPDLGSGAERRMGSIPFARTQKENHRWFSFFVRASARPSTLPSSYILLLGRRTYLQLSMKTCGRRESKILLNPCHFVTSPFRVASDKQTVQWTFAAQQPAAAGTGQRPRCFNFLRKSR